ncbi:MAG: helix-turn-helix domain-containing protein [Promethearchaeota archaeon]
MSSSKLAIEKPTAATKISARIKYSKRKEIIPLFSNENEKSVFEALRELGQVTRAVIVEKTGIPRTTAYDALSKLISKGWVIKTDVPPGKGKKGRPKAIFSLNSDPSPFSSFQEVCSPKSVNLGLFISVFTDLGPVPLVHDGIHNLIENSVNIERYLRRQSVLYQAALGIDYSPITGLYGPLPVRDYPNFLAFAYGFLARNKTSTVPRNQIASFGVLVIIFSKEDEEALPPRKNFEQTLNRLFKTVKYIDDVDRMLLLTVNMLVQRAMN